MYSQKLLNMLNMAKMLCCGSWNLHLQSLQTLSKWDANYAIVEVAVTGSKHSQSKHNWLAWNQHHSSNYKDWRMVCLSSPISTMLWTRLSQFQVFSPASGNEKYSPDRKEPLYHGSMQLFQKAKFSRRWGWEGSLPNTCSYHCHVWDPTAVAYWGNRVNQIQTAVVAEPVSFLMIQRHWNFLIWFSEKVLRRNVSLFKGSAMLNTSTSAPLRNLQGLSCEMLAQESNNRTWTESSKLRSKRTGMINLLLYWTRGANSFCRSFRCLSQTDILKWCKRTFLGQACELYSWCRSPNNLLAQQQYFKRDFKKFSLWALAMPFICHLNSAL